MVDVDVSVVVVVVVVSVAAGVSVATTGAAASVEVLVVLEAGSLLVELPELQAARVKTIANKIKFVFIITSLFLCPIWANLVLLRYVQAKCQKCGSRNRVLVESLRKMCLENEQSVK